MTPPRVKWTSRLNMCVCHVHCGVDDDRDERGVFLHGFLFAVHLGATITRAVFYESFQYKDKQGFTCRILTDSH